MPRPPYKQTINLKATLLNANIRNATLARHLGIKPQQVGAWTHGQNISPWWQTKLIKYFKGLSVNIINKY